MCSGYVTGACFVSVLVSHSSFCVHRDVDAFIDSLTRTIEFFSDVNSPNGDGDASDGGFVPFI
jgi:hypothetical protein